jgi:osmotically-inducible protein OsmY
MTQTLQKTDAALKGAVTEELVWAACLDSANIGVAADDGAVALSGEVGSYRRSSPRSMRCCASRRQAVGVTTVVNHLRIEI